jgi:FMN phosphatase YigB (HAD superfamily)
LSDKRITLIFDLDETLIHSEEAAYSGQESLNFTVSIRPYAVECLETAA